MSGHTSAGRQFCQNCDAPLTGPYCSECGQHDIDYHRSVGPVLEDALEGLLHFDGKFFKTVRFIFTRPGFLTREFIAGRRTKYTNPLRFYIFASFLFFASGFLPGPKGQLNVNTVTPEQAKTLAKAGKDADGVKKAVANEPAADRSLSKLVGVNGPIDKKAISREIAHLLPTMLFFCVPLLALGLKVAFRRTGKVYVEHFILALHIQALVFLAALATRLVGSLLDLISEPISDIFGLGAFLAGAWLVYRSIRTVYGEGPWRSFLKACLVGAVYGIVILAGIASISIASVYLVSREG